jgi:hypothetical protein
MAKKNATTTPKTATKSKSAARADGAAKADRAKKNAKAPTPPITLATTAPVAEVEPTTPEAAATDAAPQTPTSGETNARPRGRKHKSGITVIGDDEAPAGDEPAAPATSGKRAKAPKVPKEPKVKKVSALDAAAKVLAGAEKPMGAKDLITEMAAKGLWTSPGGRTPGSTLYAAIIREISAKGAGARFKKVDRGMFESTGKGV